MRRLKKKKKAENSHNSETKNSFFPSVQTKLNVGMADDVFEKEADSVADEVVNSNTEGNSIQKKGAEEEQIQEKPISQSISSVQKKDMAKEEEPIQKAEEKEEVQQKAEEKEEENVQKAEEEEKVQEKGEEEEPQAKPEEEEKVQKKGNNSRANAKVEASIKSSKGQGQKMDKATRSEMEKGFGADFSNVTIHTDANAENLSKQLGAQAFTTGNDIYFNEGKYDPNSKQGKHLLAHELTHTIQQNGSKEKKVQKNPTATTFDRLKELKNIAINDRSNFTDALRAEFASGLNELFAGMSVNHFNHATVTPYPSNGNLSPKSIYFTEGNKEHRGNPGVTQAGYMKFGMWIPNRIPSNETKEAIIFLGPNCIQDTLGYTKSVLEHEAVHVDQVYSGTSSTLSNDEVLAYSEQFNRIYEFSSNEIKSQIKQWLKYYVGADTSSRSKANKKTVYHLLYRHDTLLAQNILKELPEIKTWVSETFKDAKLSTANDGLGYIEYTLQNKK